MRGRVAAASFGIACLAGASAAGAQDAGGFTAAQRAEIVAVVRQALKQDPSILRDAVQALRADEEKAEAVSQDKAIAANRDALAVGDAVAGNPHGDVTLVEFYDPRCGYCKSMVPTIDAAIAHDPKLRVVFRVIPILGPASVTEAEAIVAAGLQGAYLPMKQALMAEAAPAGMDRIRAIATGLRLDPARLAADMQGDAVRRTVAGDLALARTLHVDGTPALVIGGQMVSGALPAGELSRAISDARS